MEFRKLVFLEELFALFSRRIEFRLAIEKFRVWSGSLELSAGSAIRLCSLSYCVVFSLEWSKEVFKTVGSL